MRYSGVVRQELEQFVEEHSCNDTYGRYSGVVAEELGQVVEERVVVMMHTGDILEL